MEILDRAAKLVTPNKTEVRRLEGVNQKVARMLREEFFRFSPAPEISLGGSYARGTWLKGSLDIDYFLLFPPDLSRDRLETDAVDSTKKALAGYRTSLRYAEHPYLEAFVDEVRVNVVPCYNVAQGEWQSAADRSPYHTKYIVSRLDDRKRLDARLLKKFVKASRVYGAEVKIQGFSGYVCEVLTLKFGSFNSVLENLSNLGQNEIISVEPFDQDLASSFKTPITILDPVDTTRNLGAAISARNVAKLVFQARRFLANPKISNFVEKEPALTPKKELLSRTVIITFSNRNRSPDILWGELRRTVASISQKMQLAGFEVLRSSAASDGISKSALLFLFSDLKISEIHVRKGPEFFRREEVENYYIKNRKRAIQTWIGDDGRVESALRRETNSAPEALKELLTERLETVGVSDDVRNEIQSGFRVLTAPAARKTSWLWTALVSMEAEE